MTAKEVNSLSMQIPQVYVGFEPQGKRVMPSMAAAAAEPMSQPSPSKICKPAGKIISLEQPNDMGLHAKFSRASILVRRCNDIQKKKIMNQLTLLFAKSLAKGTGKIESKRR